MTNFTIELLAPAKDKICAKAAVDYGADAIYIGASEFGARKNIPNSLDDIKEIIEYAHKFNVKVYVTINTILTDDELIRAKKLVEDLVKIKVDAVILQDMGLLDYTKSFPDVFPHASTQCDNRTPEKVKFLENIGFERAILARELSIVQIKSIREQTDIELEAFIHGALCVSYSGQCYLSYLIGNRSANRGECAQPCRKKYSLVDNEGNFLAKDKYLLCLKDFNASQHIKELAEAGITSFKIEGRLKDVNYVKNIVAYYRKLIDKLGYKKTSSGEILFDFEPDLNKSFNRGFTDYFLEKRGDCYTFDSPKSMGKYIGDVTKVTKEYFELKNFENLFPQDGLCFIKDGELHGCLINKVEKNKIYPNKMDGIKTGIKVYRNLDAEFEKKLKTSKTCRKIRATIEFKLGKIKVTDEDKNSVEINYEFNELAQNNEKMEVNIANQLKKSGESDFLVNNIEIKAEKLPFLPVSKLNELRRELLDKLMQERLNKYHITPVKNSNKTTCIYPQKEMDYKGNVLNQSAKEFYENHGCRVTEEAIESRVLLNSDKRGKCAMTTKHCLKYAFKLCKSPKKLYLIDEKGKKYNLDFDCKNCEMKIIF